MSPTRSLGSCAEWSEIIVPRGSNVSLDLFRGQDISLFFCFAFSLDRFWCQAQMESWVALVPPCPVETRRYGLCWCRSWTSAASTWIFILRNHRFSTSASKLRGDSMRSSKMLHGYLPLLINTYPNVGTYIYIMSYNIHGAYCLLETAMVPQVVLIIWPLGSWGFTAEPHRVQWGKVLQNSHSFDCRSPVFWDLFHLVPMQQEQTICPMPSLPFSNN